MENSNYEKGPMLFYVNVWTYTYVCHSLTKFGGLGLQPCLSGIEEQPQARKGPIQGY